MTIPRRSSSRWCSPTRRRRGAQIFRERGASVPPPVLVLFTDATQSACGVGRSAMGPFYCPTDQKVYLDLSFFRELDNAIRRAGGLRAGVCRGPRGRPPRPDAYRRFGPGAPARRRAGEREANALSVRQELQADCYAGVWGHYAARRGLLEPGDAEEGLHAAAAIGDDRLQRQVAGARGAGVVHPRVVGAAREVAPPRSRFGKNGGLRYFRAGDVLVAEISKRRSEIRSISGDVVSFSGDVVSTSSSPTMRASRTGPFGPASVRLKPGTT